MEGDMRLGESRQGVGGSSGEEVVAKRRPDFTLQFVHCSYLASCFFRAAF